MKFWLVACNSYITLNFTFILHYFLFCENTLKPIQLKILHQVGMPLNIIVIHFIFITQARSQSVILGSKNRYRVISTVESGYSLLVPARSQEPLRCLISLDAWRCNSSRIVIQFCIKNCTLVILSSLLTLIQNEDLDPSLPSNLTSFLKGDPIINSESDGATVPVHILLHITERYFEAEAD